MATVARDVVVYILEDHWTVPVLYLTISSDSELDISPGTWRRLDDAVAAHMLEVAPPASASPNAHAGERATETESGVSPSLLIDDDDDYDADDVP